MRSREGWIVLLLLGSLDNTAVAQSSTDEAVKAVQRGVSSGDQQAWSRALEVQGPARFPDDLDRVLLCMYSGCARYASAALPVTEEGFRAQFTRSVSGELGAAIVDAQLATYLSGPAEYAAFRLMALLLQENEEGVAVEGRRIVLDEQLGSPNGRPEVLRPLAAVAALAAAAVGTGAADLQAGLERIAGAFDLGGKVPARSDSATLVVLLLDVVPRPEEAGVTITWVSPEGEVGALQVVVPVIPATPQAAASCRLQGASGAQVDLPLLADFATVTRDWYVERARAAAARSLARAIGKAVVADQLGELIVGEGRRPANVAARSVINLVIAASERADTRAARYVPRLIYAGVAPMGPEEWQVACDAPMHLREFPVIAPGNRAVVGAFSLRGTWGKKAHGLLGLQR